MAWYPKLSSPQIAILPASSRFPKNFQPVGVSKQSFDIAAATLTKFDIKMYIRVFEMFKISKYFERHFSYASNSYTYLRLH